MQTHDQHTRTAQTQQDTLQAIVDLHRDNPDALRIIINAASQYWTICDLGNAPDDDHDELATILDRLNPIG